MAAVNTTRGRPKKWKSPKAMQKAIDAYFEECEGELLKDKLGTPVTDKRGVPIFIGRKPPTISGLTYYLGFENRKALLYYENDDEFSPTIARAKMRVQAYTEERLFDRDGARGAEFSLRCNFGWNDKDDSMDQDSNETGVIMLTPVIEVDNEDLDEKGESEDEL